MTQGRRATPGESRAAGDRIRGSTFGERRPVPLRLAKDLYGRLSEHCRRASTPANTYLVGMLDDALRPRSPALPPAPAGGAANGAERIALTLRMRPDLHARLMAFCERKGISANAYISGLLGAALPMRPRRR